MPAGLSIYNQTILGDEDFVANFVARHQVLDALLRQLRAAEPSGTLHHVLVGPRGMGKTSLLRRLAIATNRETDLAERYVPLRFREEQYNVLTLGDFWRNCGEALAEWAEETRRDALAQRLDAEMPTHLWADDAAAAEQFRQELTALGRRAILLVDNIDLILDALPDEANWTLRRRLQARQGPIMICAATQPLAQSADRDAAFYEFFQPHHLEPLDERETESCMRALARRRGEPGDHVVAVLNTQPERLKTLHTLTGGNPRVLALIYRLLETAESEAAMADLELLLDQVTPYYKAKVEEYVTAQQRAVIDAISLNWDPITTGDLSRVTDIPTTTLSSLLIKLRKDGLIENVETSGSYAGHQLVERFFNIWYLMRHGTRRAKQKMRWLVGFLTSFYSPQELADIARRVRSGGMARVLHADYALALDEALARQRPAHEFTESLTTGENPIAVKDDQLLEAERLTLEAEYSWKREDILQCLTTLETLLARFADTEEASLLQVVAQALFNKGVVLKRTGNHTAAIAAYDDVIDRFADAERATLRELAAKALVDKGVTLGQTGNSAAEIAAYDDVIARFANAKEAALREQVAWAQNNRGIALGLTGDRAAEIAAYDDVVARFADAEETALRAQVAKALINKGIVLSRTDDSAAAICVCDEVIARFAGDAELVPRELVAAARVLIANLLFDEEQDIARAEELYLEAAPVLSLVSSGNLAWLYLSTDRLSDVVGLRHFLSGLPDVGLFLLDAAIEIAKDNFGDASNYLSTALLGDLNAERWDFSDDLNRLLRLAERKGYGERLITWFEQAGLADRLAPVYVAFKAYVRGEQVLLDVNPEVRRPAKIIYDRLDAPRRYKRETAPKKPQAKRPRGRPRKAAR